MIEELHTSGSLLKAALEKYLDTCSTIANRFEARNAFTTISEVVTGELELITSYETIMKRAKADILRVRNSCPIIVPINALPPEVLTRIFQLVVRSQRGLNDQSKHSRPEVLSHVCSRWYQIAIGFPGLWNYIDLALSDSLDNLLAWGNTLATRAGSLALGINIVVPRAHDPDKKLRAFCASIAQRIKSLEMTVHHGGQRTHLSMLKTCFSNCVPGTLNHLYLKGHFAESPSTYYLFINAGHPTGDSSQVLLVPNRQPEDVLLHVKALHLRGVYFRWNSWAYHRLVELTLLPQTWFRFPSVDESQLRGMLAASPMLREFTFGLGITEIAQDEPPTPIVLSELECMRLCFMGDSQRKALFRMVSPGPKPLSVALVFRKVFPPDHDEEFDMFLARARVTDLSIRIQSHRDGGNIPYLPKLLRLSPSLRNLSLYGYSHGSTSKHRVSDLDGGEHLPAGLHLNTLSLFYCNVNLAQLKQMAKIIPIQTLRFVEDYAPRFIDQLRFPMRNKGANELHEMFPASVVQLVAPCVEDFSDDLGVDD